MTQSDRDRNWFGTFFGSGDDGELMSHKDFGKFLVNLGATKYVYQLEKCKTSGRLHYQWVAHFEHAKKFSAIRNSMLNSHVEQVGNSAKSNWDAAVDYCRKEDTRVAGPWHLRVARKLPDPPAPRPGWGADLYERISEPCMPSDRKVLWIYDPRGGAGKTTFAKYALKHLNVLYVTGKSGDMKYLLKEHVEKHGDVDVIFVDVTRTQENFLAYQGIEELKNGICVSTKYECAVVQFPVPHVVVFSNNLPNYAAMSMDRWEVITVSEKEEFSAFSTFAAYGSTATVMGACYCKGKHCAKCGTPKQAYFPLFNGAYTHELAASGMINQLPVEAGQLDYDIPDLN